MTWIPQVLANSFMSLCVLQCMVKVMGTVPFQTVVEMISLILAISSPNQLSHSEKT